MLDGRIGKVAPLWPDAESKSVFYKSRGWYVTTFISSTRALKLEQMADLCSFGALIFQRNSFARFS
jgi:hypothetical protein